MFLAFFSSPQKRLVSNTFFIDAALAIALLGAILHISFGQSEAITSGHAWGSDDAYITFRYAKNAADGLGAVYNPGERVEGYSNPLYVTVLAVVAKIGTAAALYPTTLVINTLALLVLVALFGMWLSRLVEARLAGLSVLAVAAFPPLWAAVASALETPLTVLLQFTIVLSTWTILHGANRRLLVVLLIASGLAVVARPDGFIFPCLAVAALMIGGRLRDALLTLSAVVVAVCIMVGWRLFYYGLPLPMTYYAKVTGSLPQRVGAGIQQLAQSFITGMLPHLMVVSGLGIYTSFQMLREKSLRPASRKLGVLALFGCAWIAYWIYIGGDVFAERFLLIIALLSWVTISFLLNKRQRIWLLAPIFLLQMGALAFDGRFNYERKTRDMWIGLGTFLGESYPGKVLAIDAAGKVPFFSDLQTIDMLGLNDAHIGRLEAAFTHVGHSKMDPDYVLGRNPDLIAAWLQNPSSLAAEPEWGSRLGDD
jgi:hypothetical protein